MREMVDCMYEKVYTEGQLVIQEGEAGNYLYVLAGQLSKCPTTQYLGSNPTSRAGVETCFTKAHRGTLKM